MKARKTATVSLFGAITIVAAISAHTALAKVSEGINASLGAPAPYLGTCPAKVELSGYITAGDAPNGKWKFPVDVRFRIIYSDGVRGSIQTRHFPSPNAQVVRFNRTFTGSFAGWAAIEILQPERKLSNKVPVKVNCQGSQPSKGSALPDLTVVNIRLNTNCQVVVTVNNLGPGTVANAVWAHHTPVSSGVYITVNGRRMGGATIWFFDPSRRLQNAGRPTDYESTYVVTGTATVHASIDHTRQVAERREDNNALTRQLSCGGGLLVKEPGGGAVQLSPARR